jgi:hemolysin activation/secretion protein
MRYDYSYFFVNKQKSQHCRIIFMKTVFLFSALLSLASASDNQRTRDIIAQQESAREKQLENYFQDKRPPQKITSTDTPLPKQDAKKKFIFKKITLDGATLLSASEINRLSLPYLNKPLDLSDLNTLIQAVTDAYMDRGYVSARVYIKPQNIKDGILRLIVIEGRLKAIKVTRNGKDDSRWFTPIPASSGDHVNIRDLEQGVDQITRLRSYQAKLDLEPGQHDGDSDAVITTNQDLPVGASFTMDNSGSRATGRVLQTTSAFADDVLGLYDSWMISGQTDTDRNSSDHFYRNLSIQTSIPCGYWTFKYALSYYKTRTTSPGVLQNYKSDGNTRNNRIEIERIIHRDSDSKTGLALFIYNRANRNYFEGAKIDVSSKKITPVGARLFDNRRLSGGILSSSLSFYRGTKLLGAQRKRLAKNSSDPQFRKLTADVSYDRPFEVWTQLFKASTSVSLQHSKQNLYSSERVSFGNASTVRGVLDGGLSGDTGGYVSNELAWKALKSNNPDVTKTFGSGWIYAGFDWGKIKNNPDNPYERGVLSSITGGLRTQGGKLNLDIGVSRLLNRPSFIKREGTVAHVRVSLNF